MTDDKIEEIKCAADKVLERYINSITRKAFIKFTKDVIEIVSRK